MKKLLTTIFSIVSSCAIAAGTTVDGEYYEHTKSSAPSKLPYIQHSNVVDVASKVFHSWWDPFEATYLPGTSVNFYNSPWYPSYAYSSFNVNLGIDNEVGVPPYVAGTDNSPTLGRYSVAIGTSNKAIGMHSYTWGSQLNVVTSNATAIGYGITAADQWSTVIGHGKRPTTNGVTYDYTNTAANVAIYLQSIRNNIFPGFHIHVTDTKQILTITNIRSTANSFGFYYDWVLDDRDVYVKVVPGSILTKLGYLEYYYEKEGSTYKVKSVNAGDVADDNTYRLFSPDYISGKYDWRYGKTHGPGTFNIVAWGMPGYSQYSPGLKAVYINDDPLDYLVRKELEGPTVRLSNTQISKGITFVKDGYEQNCPVEIGKDAVAGISQATINSISSSGTIIRNASVAIGGRASATNASSKTTQQSIAIGYCANAAGGQSVAIGGGSRSLNEETDLTGNNAYASGATSIAIGYSTKATGNRSVAIGSGQSGTMDHTQATGTDTVAIGHSAQATATGSVQLGTGTNNTPNSLQFMGVKIVENGRLLGGNADPKELSITPTTSTELEFSIDPGSVITVLPSSNCGPGTEIAISPTSGLRNYEIYLPNEPEVREGLPTGFSLDELPAEVTQRIVKNNKWQAYKLPAKITLKQPYSKLVIAEIEEMDDGSSWDPVITNCNLKWSFDQRRFITNGKKLLEGTNLHAGVSMKLAYPISGGKVSTNELFEVNTDGILDGTFYGWTMSTEFAPTGITTTSGDNSWFEIIYETSAGTKPAVWRQEFDMSE